MLEQTIQLDCSPGSLRPDDLINSVLEGTGLEAGKITGKFFGCWTWDFSNISRKKYEKIRPILKRRVTALFNSGTIRYGSW